MQKYFILPLFIVPFVAKAQITIANVDMPVVNSVHYYATSNDFSSVDPTLTGASYSWDYSMLTSSGADTVAFVPVSSTPFAYQLYFNNAFMYPDYVADYATKGQDVSAFGQVNITERYDFSRVDNDALRLTGFGANVNGVPASVKYDTIDQIYPLPMTYGTNDSTSAYYIVSIPNMGTYGQWIRRKVDVDGWGELITPYTTYPDVIRVKTILYQRDTMYVDQFSYGTTFDRPVEYIYEWFAPGEQVAVMQVTEQGGQVSAVKYRDQLSGITQYEKLNLSVYPNPVRETLNISEHFTGTVTVSDMNGTLVRTWKANELKSVNLGCLNKGMYIVTLTSEKGEQSISIVKL